MLKKLKQNKKGFTLAELLVVVAILAILVAVAIPVFRGAVGQAEAAVTNANFRAAKAQASVQYLLEKDTATKYFDYTVDANGNITLSSSSKTVEEKASQTTGTVKVSSEEFTLKN